MRARPPSGFESVVSTFMVVVLPAPLGPKRPKTLPRSTLKETLSSAAMLPYCLVNPVTSIMIRRALARRLSRIARQRALRYSTNIISAGIMGRFYHLGSLWTSDPSNDGSPDTEKAPYLLPQDPKDTKPSPRCWK